MRLLYDLFFLIFSLLYIPYLLMKGKVHRDFFQKFGFLPKAVTSFNNPVWIHAVSVGEATLAVKLSQAIKARFSDIQLVVSTTTATGNDMVRKSNKGVVDAVFYYPLDIRAIVSRVVRLVNPCLYIMIETELWPNFLEELCSKNIPVILANGRISDASFTNYHKIKFIVKRILKCIDYFCMQSNKDAARISKLGAPPNKVFVTGNMKFDEAANCAGSSGISRERLRLTCDNEIIIAGSTHSPEEKIIINVFKKLKNTRDKLKLILVPRHVERTNEVLKILEKTGLRCQRFSEILKQNNEPNNHNSPSTIYDMRHTIYGTYDVLLIDTIGHLKDLYSAADIVFVGGSFAKKGGQNPIEAARWGKPVIFGPHMFNFREVAEVFLENRAALRLENVSGLEKTLNDLLEDSNKRNQIGENAKKVIEENTGALDRTVDKIETYLKV